MGVVSFFNVLATGVKLDVLFVIMKRSKEEVASPVPEAKEYIMSRMSTTAVYYYPHFIAWNL